MAAGSVVGAYVNVDAYVRCEWDDLVHSMLVPILGCY